MSNILVAYFSATNVTKTVAEELAEIEGADLYAITPAQPYTPEDLDWRNEKSRSTVEMQDTNCHPPIVGTVENFEKYDTVFLCFPLWWGREPSVVDTFLTENDFAGKTIIPLCTSGGSPIGFTGDRIAAIAKGGPKVVNGNRVGVTVSREDLKLWAEGLDIE